MTLKALIFAGLGALAEYSDIDREAWNAAFRTHGLRWDWSWDTYTELMRPGGERQLPARYADFLGVEVDAEQLDRAHIRSFAARMSGTFPLRPGAEQLLTWAVRGKVSLGLVSRADPGVVHPVLAATARARRGIEFDTILTQEDGGRMAPHPDAVVLALQQLEVEPQNALAVADTPASAAACLDAGLQTLAFPGAMAEDQSFPQGVFEVTSLHPGGYAATFGFTAPAAAE